MILRYKSGFQIETVIYGWREGNLFRLPQMIGKSFYPLKEIKLITQKRKSGEFKGYLLYGNKRKSKAQLKSMTHFINFEHEEVEGSDLPF